MSPESNPAFQAAWKAHSSSFPIAPFDSERELFRAGYESRDAEVERLRGALEASVRVFEDNYFGWETSGGPDECAHGYARGIHCRTCDIAEARAALKPEQTNA